MRNGLRIPAFCLIAAVSLSGCTLLGVDYESTSTGPTAAPEIEGRLQAMESRLDYLENSLEAIQNQPRR